MSFNFFSLIKGNDAAQISWEQIMTAGNGRNSLKKVYLQMVNLHFAFSCTAEILQNHALRRIKDMLCCHQSDMCVKPLIKTTLGF